MRSKHRPFAFLRSLAVLALTALLAFALSSWVAPDALGAQASNRDAIAVIIGNKSYTGDIPAVAYAHRDAEAMKRFVVDVLGYRSGNLIDLRDATGKQIEAVFGNADTVEGKLFDWIRPEKSDVLIFYSGHGVPGLKDQRPYLLPVDGDANRAEITGYSVDLLYANLAKSRARSVMVFLDACFSGGSPKGMLVKATSGLSISAKLPPSLANMTIITAADRDQFASWDEQAQHGLFTHYLLKGLYGKADGSNYGNGDGRITATEIKEYLDDEMTYSARRRFGRRQTASVYGDTEAALAVIDPAAPPVRPTLDVVEPPIAATPAPVPPIAAISPPPPPDDYSFLSGNWIVKFVVTQCFIQFPEELVAIVITGKKFKGRGNVINVSGRITGPDAIVGDAWVPDGIAEFRGKLIDGVWSGDWDGTEGCNGTFTFARKS